MLHRRYRIRTKFSQFPMHAVSKVLVSKFTQFLNPRDFIEFLGKYENGQN
jgi:hypothetical protein